MAWRCNADPGTLEDFDAFKGRVRNAVAWLNGNAKKKEEMTGAVDSMRRRLASFGRMHPLLGGVELLQRAWVGVREPGVQERPDVLDRVQVGRVGQRRLYCD